MAAARNGAGENPLIKRLPIKDSNGRIVGHKEVVAYRGLLDLVHRDRVSRITTRLVQTPREDNGQTAIVRAVVHTARGVFTALGDANPRNVNPKIVPHLVRMAETRAEARAMRKAVNIGVVALEELDDLPEDVTLEGTMLPVEPAHETPRPGNGAAHPQANDGEDDGAPPASAAAPPPTVSRPSFGSSRASEQQRRYLYRLLAERDITGERARALIQERLGVSSLAEASKGAVSRLIDELRSNGTGDSPESPPAA
ncbi:MAG: hypothetical protein IT379_14610 [Deltaproteobacteria bacterium]|nr:hypothetical protein [Deltaproteobacteria bacterium]